MGGIITLTAFISPFKEEREMARSLMPHGDFIEIHCFCPLEVCETRDVKGLYKRARKGEIKDFIVIHCVILPSGRIFLSRNNAITCSAPSLSVSVSVSTLNSGLTGAS
jgi:hypothetical protein